jgi:carbon-monoxide dehydrogenase small subunit
VNVNPESVELTLTVNGLERSAVLEARTLLVHLLRDEFGLVGTKIGCDSSQCGTCTVIVDSRAVKSCTLLAGQVNGSSVTTIEGLATGTALHPVQRAFHEQHALQCGFCTPGMILTAVDLLSRDEPLTADIVRTALSGNLCRCTGYEPIVDAVLAAASTRGS